MSSLIPDTIQNDETLVRIIFSPYHVRVNKKTGKIRGIKNSAFHSIPDMDEVSVTRINYSSFDVCKAQAKKMENDSKEYQGFAVIKYIDVIESGAFVKVTKTIDNPAHADIYYNIIKKRGEAYPAEILLVIESIVSKSTFIEDPSPSEDKWQGKGINDLTNF